MAWPACPAAPAARRTAPDGDIRRSTARLRQPGLAARHGASAEGASKWCPVPRMVPCSGRCLNPSHLVHAAPDPVGCTCACQYCFVACPPAANPNVADILASMHGSEGTGLCPSCMRLYVSQPLALSTAIGPFQCKRIHAGASWQVPADSPAIKQLASAAHFTCFSAISVACKSGPCAVVVNVERANILVMQRRRPCAVPCLLAFLPNLGPRHPFVSF